MKRCMELQIKGEYETTILIQNMFNTYVFKTENRNIVTDEGLNLILKMVIGESDEKFGSVHVGKNSTEPSSLDTVTTFTQPISLDNYDIDINGNNLIYKINTSGEKIDNTCEIGIWSNGSSPKLITRDVHENYDIPSSAIVTIQYSLELSNKEKSTEEITEENNNND